jgi:FkbM family methyltransferase
MNIFGSILKNTLPQKDAENLFSKFEKKSFSQSGEDLIIDFIFNALGISRPSYIDIGAHHPYYLNNTAIFYLRGARGINIEPDPSLFSLFLNHRKEDTNLNIGISDTLGTLDFHVMNIPTLNTFSAEEADKYSLEGDYYIKEIKKINVEPISKVISDFKNGVFPDFLTLDAEGIDEIVLKSIDYDNNKPIVICTETISFSEKGKGVKNVEIIQFLESKGYMLYADTHINSIFVEKNRWIRN